MPNPNHPKPGSSTLVQPIRQLEDIQSIKKLLASKPRDLLLFTLGINNGIRTGDLLTRKISDVHFAKPGQTIQIRESKTGKTNTLSVNREVYKALRGHLEASDHRDDEYLFPSGKCRQKPLTIMAVNRMIKSWCKAINLPGNYGAHSLRKTFGYIQRTHFGVGFELICKRLNHSSPSVTMRYLGIEDKEVLEILTHEI